MIDGFCEREKHCPDLLDEYVSGKKTRLETDDFLCE